MEENIKVEKKNKHSLIIILATILLCCSAFVALVLTGIIPVKTGIGFTNIHTAAIVKKATQVSDEATLRELLLLKETLDIYVTEDIEIDETFVVRGDKTLYGDATISADVAGEFRQMPILDVQMGAKLTLDGLVLDGSGTADGINVGQKAELNILSGTIQYMRDGIRTNGFVKMEGGLLQYCSQESILADFKSKVYLNGGKIYNSGDYALNVAKMAYAEINDGMLIDKCGGYAVANNGELNVYGGTISNVVAVGIMTKDAMRIEYKGNDPKGGIVLENIGTSGIHIYGKKNIYISDVHGTNIGRNAIWNAGDATGKVTVEDCYFENTGMIDSNGISLHGKGEINRVTMKSANEGAMYLRKDSEFTLNDVSIEGVKGTAISVEASKVIGKNVRISKATQHNLLCMTGSEVEMKDSVFEKSKRTNIYMSAKSKLTLDSVELQGVLDDDLYCIHVSNDAELTTKGNTSITGTTRVAICLYQNAKMTMEGGKIFGVKGNDNGAGVWVREEGAVFTMKGGSIQDNYTKSTSGAVYVANKTTFNMYGGTISGNSCDYSGGAVQVQGVMNMYGGTISDNYSKTSGGGINVGNNRDKGIFGTLNVYGGTIKNNKAFDGGGIHVSGGTTCNISGGTIQGNEAERHGDGIKDNGKLTVSGKAYIPGNAIELDSTSVILKIEGSTLTKHSKKDPLHVIPCGFTNVGNVVVECDSNSASASLLDNYVTSGTRAYTLKQKDNNMTVSINSADMDMTGAKSVYVSTFQELKEAVETAEDKLIVVICADIKWESPITPPLGTTVKVRDDGQTRILSRAEGNTSRFFISFFGSGFILEATSPGRLVVDGKTTSELTGSVVSMFMRGDTIVSGVTFKDNGFADGSGGGFFNQINGVARISECTFENGSAINGGAINQAGGAMVVEDCIFKNNQASEYGGAVYFMGKSAQVKNCTFITNEATRGGALYGGTNCDVTLTSNKNNVFEGNKAVVRGDMKDVRGGAICIGSGTLTIDRYQFINNTSAKTGGAIHFNENDKIIAKITDSTFANNASQAQGGAIYSGSSNKDSLTVAQSEFIGNTSKTQGGAIHIYGSGKAVTKLTDTSFVANTAGDQGGAITAFATTLKIQDSNFGGKESVDGNSSEQGAAIYSGDKSKVDIVTSKGSVFQNNKAEERAGAICIGSGTLTVDGYEFANNSSAKTGGAIHLNENETIVAKLTEVTFDSNTSKAQGGAIYCGSLNKESITLANAKFIGNQAGTQGGAIHVYGGGKGVAKITDTTFTGNTAGTQGGAITAFATTLKITDSNFGGQESAKGNSSVQGAAIYSGQSSKVELVSTKESVFQNNKATGSDARGGAICIGSGTLTIEGYEFANNSSAKTGGAIHLNENDSIVAKISNTIFESNKAHELGGAIYSGTLNATEGLQVAGSTFARNQATYSGGAIVAPVGKVLTVSDSKFTGNVSEKEYGGAILVYTATATITDCDFGGVNKADGNSAIRGGAIYSAANCAVTMTSTKDSVIQNNTATERGGAINVGKGSLTVTGYNFVGNTCSSGAGGAIHLNGDNIVSRFVESTFTSNVATGNGGAIYNNSTNTVDGFSVVDSVFTTNNAAAGGAIYHQNNAPMNVTGSTFSKNTANDNGGAIFTVTVAPVTISGSTFTENTATNWNGGAIFAHHVVVNNVKQNNELTITDSTFKANNAVKDKNEAGQGGAIFTYAKTTKITGCDFGDENAGNNARQGGAIYSGSSCALTIENSTFAKNSSLKEGGAIFSATDAAMTISGSTFTGNVATNNSGGAILAQKGTELNVSNSSFKGNTAVKEYGGAILVYTTTAKFTDCDFGGANKADGNSAIRGGAIYSGNNCAVTMESTKNSVIQNNTATERGGAINVGSGSLTITGYNFVSNTCSKTGGAIHLNGDNIVCTITGSTFTSNAATGNGGAIFTNSTNATEGLKIVNSTFTSNTSSQGGAAIYSEDGSKAPVSVSGSTFEKNTVTWSGGAILVKAGSGKTLTISDSIFKNNKGTKEFGGAIFTLVTTNATNCEFTGNTAISNTNVFYTTSTVTLDGCTKLTGKESGGSDYWANGGTVIQKNSK